MSNDLTAQVTTDVVRSTNYGRSVEHSKRVTSNGVQAASSANRQVSPEVGNILPSMESGEVSTAVDAGALTEAVSKIKDHVQNIQRQLEFSVDEDLNRVVIRVYDSETEEVIRQIPAEEVLVMARNLTNDDQNGLLLEVEA
ncbi:MAG: flagellar protein FlaG [Gammaproteobacteria bacterium]